MLLGSTACRVGTHCSCQRAVKQWQVCRRRAPGIGWRYVDAIRDGPEVHETGLQSSIRLALKLLKLFLSQKGPGTSIAVAGRVVASFVSFRAAKFGHGRVSTRPSGEGAGGRLAVGRVTVWARLQIPQHVERSLVTLNASEANCCLIKEEKGRVERNGEEEESERLWRLETAVRASQGSGCCC